MFLATNMIINACVIHIERNIIFFKEQWANQSVLALWACRLFTILRRCMSSEDASLTSSKRQFQRMVLLMTLVPNITFNLMLEFTQFRKRKKKHVFLQNLPHYARPTLQLPSNQVSQHTASSLIRNPNETLCETLVTNMLYISQDTHISQESSINHTPQSRRKY